MFIDDIERTGSVTRVRVIAEDPSECDESAAGTFVLQTLWDGMGDWDEVVKIERGVYEVICS